MDTFQLLKPPTPEMKHSRMSARDALKKELVILTNRLNLVDLQTAFEIMKKRCNDMKSPDEMLKCHKLEVEDLAYAFGIF